MTKKQKAELEAWAKKQGFEVVWTCSYCQEGESYSPDGGETHFLVTFVKEI